jgi:hypothetical protein
MMLGLMFVSGVALVILARLAARHSRAKADEAPPPAVTPADRRPVTLNTAAHKTVRTAQEKLGDSPRQSRRASETPNADPTKK